MPAGGRKVSAIILAGGNGTRFHGRKQFAMLGDHELWEYPYHAVSSLIEKSNIKIVGIDVPGGQTRSQSVLNGLLAVDDDTARVIIVEAARPTVTAQQIKTLIDCDSPSVSFVRPLVNTVVYRNGVYIDRNELYELLTPQAFDYKLLLTAMKSGKFLDMTDETRVMNEFYNIKPKFIETTSMLFKVTYPEDICILDALMKREGQGS